MNSYYSANPAILGVSECEQLCGVSYREVEELGSYFGLSGLTGQPLLVSVPNALNMLAVSLAKSNGVERHAATAWLPGLRNEALLELGGRHDNWYFDGTAEAGNEFDTTFHAGPYTVRSRVAGLLGCSSVVTTRELRFFSQSDIEYLSPAQYEQGCNGRTPRFVIDSHVMAGKVRAVCRGPLFTVRARRTV